MSQAWPHSLGYSVVSDSTCLMVNKICISTMPRPSITGSPGVHNCPCNWKNWLRVRLCLWCRFFIFLTSGYVKVVEILPRWHGKLQWSISLFPQELLTLHHVPVNVNGGSNGKLVAGWGSREDSKKYGWESQEEYMHNQWHVDQYKGGNVAKMAIVKGGHHERCTASNFSFIALSETYLGNYYAKVSTFSQPERERKLYTELQHVVLISLTRQTWSQRGSVWPQTYSTVEYHGSNPRWLRNSVLTGNWIGI